MEQPNMGINFAEGKFTTTTRVYNPLEESRNGLAENQNDINKDLKEIIGNQPLQVEGSPNVINALNKHEQDLKNLLTEKVQIADKEYETLSGEATNQKDANTEFTNKIGKEAIVKSEYSNLTQAVNHLLKNSSSAVKRLTIGTTSEGDITILDEASNVLTFSDITTLIAAYFVYIDDKGYYYIPVLDEDNSKCNFIANIRETTNAGNPIYDIYSIDSFENLVTHTQRDLSFFRYVGIVRNTEPSRKTDAIYWYNGEQLPTTNFSVKRCIDNNWEPNFYTYYEKVGDVWFDENTYNILYWTGAEWAKIGSGDVIDDTKSALTLTKDTTNPHLSNLKFELKDKENKTLLSKEVSIVQGKKIIRVGYAEEEGCIIPNLSVEQATTACNDFIDNGITTMFNTYIGTSSENQYATVISATRSRDGGTSTIILASAGEYLFDYDHTPPAIIKYTAYDFGVIDHIVYSQKHSEQIEVFSASDVFVQGGDSTHPSCINISQLANAKLYVSGNVATFDYYISASISQTSTGWKAIAGWNTNWKYQLDTRFIDNNVRIRNIGSMYASNKYANTAFDILQNDGVRMYYTNELLNATGGINISLRFPVVKK